MRRTTIRRRIIHTLGIQPNIQPHPLVSKTKAGVTRGEKKSNPFRTQEAMFALAPNAYYKHVLVKFIEPDFSKIAERRQYVDNLIDIVTASANKRIYTIIEKLHRRNVRQYYRENFAAIKENAYAFKAESAKEEALISDIINAQTPAELIKTIEELEYEVLLNLPSYVDLQGEAKNLTPTSEQTDLVQQKFSQYARRVIELRKLIVPKTTSEEVQISEDLLKALGVEDVCIGNDEQLAKMLVTLIERMKGKNDKIPTGIIVAPSTYSRNGVTLSFEDKCYMVINPLSFEKKEHRAVNRCIENAIHDERLGKIHLDEQIYARDEIAKSLRNYTSTDSLYHNIAHEAGHIQHKKGYEFVNLDLTPEDLEIAKSLSNLAYNAKTTPELYAELYAKKLLTDELTTEEARCLLYLSELAA